ncbi:unnamed protein product [Ectocarpus sp. CCAP 1310/34]|nr:unnamed protein product [Ectocarpus sp. CCAP 1310/34]
MRAEGPGYACSTPAGGYPLGSGSGGSREGCSSGYSVDGRGVLSYEVESCKPKLLMSTPKCMVANILDGIHTLHELQESDYHCH